ncbi:hypothetical protein SmJEL517_g02559 [Synchytrium microbalum]|uniref:Major facilitator superfamily (MFS) profile domain-containing protein n=1 Tax=Synchytrium microbalum TaxID=1806994 RepID=A0A507BZX4_9FUNG|nr:uncharacterized protein SmJEL517_g02559 [Synchytrium microbalum]TPX34820.1 hypothetical protein SmJEL517_g02559 [Synchytrium microbalum]
MSNKDTLVKDNEKGNALGVQVSDIDGAEHVELYDSSLEWTEHEEKTLVNLLDLSLLPYIGLLIFVNQLDRANISNAITNTFFADTGSGVNEVSYSTMVYQVGFIVSEIPSSIIMRRVGAHIWLPTLAVGWGVVSLLQTWFLTSVSSLYTFRFFVGLFEGGFIPGTAFLLTRFYKKRETAGRLSVFWATQALTTGVGGIIAFGTFSNLSGHDGLAGWRWFILIEAVLTIGVALGAFIYLRESPAKWWALTKRQQQIAANRIVKDDPSKAYPFRAEITREEIVSALTDVNIYFYGILAFFSAIPINSFGGFLPYSIANFGFGGLTANLLSLPPYVALFFSLLLFSYSSDRTSSRALHSFTAVVVFAIGLILVEVLQYTSPNKYALYFSSIVAVAGFTSWHAINAAWVTENTTGQGRRTVALAVYIIFTNLAAFVSGWIYRSDDAPSFKRGNGINIAATLVAASLYLVQRYRLIQINKQRATQWDLLTDIEKEVYAKEHPAGSDDRRLNFVYNY